MSWVIDTENTVHAHYCVNKVEPTLPYLSKPKTYQEMHNWLARPDQQHMVIHKSGNWKLIKPCVFCIPDGDEVL